MLDRRTFLALGGAAALMRTGNAAAAEPLTLWGPPAAPSIILAEAAASGELGEIAESVTFKSWRTPDEMRAGLGSGSMQVVLVPSYVAANLYNRGLGIQLVNIMTRGLLYVVAPEDVAGVKDLAGRKVAVPFHNDMPDFIFRRLLAAAGMEAGRDIELNYAGSPPEAMQMLLSGRVDAALLSEPAATAAILRDTISFGGLVRAIDCQKEWAKATGGSDFLPQAGLAVSDAFVEKVGDKGLRVLQKALLSAADFVTAHPTRAALSAAGELGLMSAVVSQAIPYSNLTVLPASSVRRELEDFFSVLAADDPRIIGGKLPDDKFYAL